MAVAKKLNKKQQAIYVSLVAVVVLAIVGFIAYDFWTVHQKTQAILVAPGVITTANTEDPTKAAEGTETAPVAKADLSTYKVAADAPRIITISKIGITARVR